MNLKSPPFFQFWYAIAGRTDFEGSLLDKLTFPSSIEARNPKKDGNNGDQGVQGGQDLPLKLDG